MANHNLILEQNHVLSLRPRQHLVLRHDHNLALSRDHNFELVHMHDQDMDLGHLRDHVHGLGHIHDLDLDLEHSSGKEFELGNTHDRGLALGQTHEHEMDLGHAHVPNPEEKNLNLKVDIDFEADEDHNDIDNLDSGLAIAVDSHVSGLSDNHELVVVENDDLHGNLDLAMDQNQEISIAPASDMTLQQPQLIVNAPILQPQALVSGLDQQLTVGQEFPDVQSCRRALRDAAISFHFELQTVKSDKLRFTVKCAGEGCPWRIHAAKLPGVPTFTIRTIHNEHTCGGINHLGHQQASVQWVADSVEQQLRENPNCKPKEILEEIHRVHGITLSYKQAWRGKERIMASVRGSFEEDYRLLPQYCDQIRRTNPGSIAHVYGNPADNCFQRLFVSFQASIYGFLNACRPLIGLDRMPLKSKYLGTLLFATSFDGDGALFPLAFGVVDEENDDNWMWFLSELHTLLESNSENMPRLTILSDRQKGIIDGVEANFPTAFHGFCLRYLCDSFQKEFNNTVLVNLLWEAAYALTAVGFDSKILEIAEILPEAACWIRQFPPHLWATAYFEGPRFGHLTANIVESLNSWIVEASGLPIIQTMECIRRRLMTWFNECRDTSMQWTSILVPSAENHVSEAIKQAHSYHVMKANEATFEVISHQECWVVDIRARRCTCNGWHLCGLPCAHAVAALLSCRQNVHRFTERCFTVANYRKAYSQTIHPIPDKTLWNEMSVGSQNEGEREVEIIINPPKSLRPPGQPRKRQIRREDGGRTKRVVHCSRCNQTGHFRTTCAAPI